MEVFNLDEYSKFDVKSYNLNLLHDSPSWRVITFNFKEGQELPRHSHDVDSEVMILILEGEGYFISGEEEIPAKAGSMLIAKVSEPHGLRAKTDLRALVVIAPPI